MKTCGACRDSSTILDIGRKWRWMLNVTASETVRVPLNRRLPRSCGEREQNPAVLTIVLMCTDYT
jgi:hypothetical protein